MASARATSGRRAPRRGAKSSAADHIIAGIPTAWLVAFFVAPLCFTVVFSFAHPVFGGAELGFTLGNYSMALSGFYLGTFLRTLELAGLACLLCLAVAFPAAYFIARHAGRFKSAALCLVLVPYLTSYLIRVMSWEVLFAAGGPLQDVVNALGLHRGPLGLLDSQAAVFIGMVYAYLPIAIVPLYVVLERIPGPLMEASQDLGGSRWRSFVHVTLPCSRPGVATAVLLTVVPMLGELVIPQLLGGGRGLLMGSVISSQFLQAQDYTLGSAMAVLVLLAVTIIVVLLARLTKGFVDVSS